MTKIKFEYLQPKFSWAHKFSGENLPWHSVSKTNSWFFFVICIPVQLTYHWLIKKKRIFLAVLVQLSPIFAWGLSLTLKTICICCSQSNWWYMPKNCTQKNHNFGWKYPKFWEKSKMAKYQLNYFHIVEKKQTKKFISNFFIYITFKVKKGHF